MKFEKWHAAAGAVGAMLASATCAFLEAEGISIVEHWLEIGLGSAGVLTVLFGAALAVIRKKKSTP